MSQASLRIGVAVRAEPQPFGSRQVVERDHIARAVDRLCPSCLAADRDDIIQNTLIRLHQLQTSGDSETLISASYIWKTAYSVIIDEVRRRRRRPATSLDDMPVVLRLVHSGPSPEQVAAGRELGAGIRACLAELTKSRRVVVVLYLQGHSVTDIAGLLGWTTKKAENFVYRALGHLRSGLASKGLRPEHPARAATMRARVRESRPVSVDR